jgi:hypothetical protein
MNLQIKKITAFHDINHAFNLLIRARVIPLDWG